MSEKDEGQNLEMNFENEVQKSGWSLLKDHFERGTLYLLSDDLNLLDVSKAMAKDDVDFIKSLLEKKSMRSLTDNEIEKLKSGEEVSFTIVSPFVLIQFDKA